MPRTIEEIANQAEELAAGFKSHEPDADHIRDAGALRELRQALPGTCEGEQRVTTAVERARTEGHSWASIGAMIGTSGEAARQRYGKKTPKS